MELVANSVSRFHYTKTNHGYGGHGFKPLNSIQRLMEATPFCEHHVSIQGFIDNEPVFSQLLFDVDNEDDIESALSTARAVEWKLSKSNIGYDTYFSGNKGFHIVTDCLILGEDSHLVCGEIQKKFFNFDNMDNQIYRNKGTIRAVGSINLKTGMFKTKIDSQWRIEKILAESTLFRGNRSEFSYAGNHGHVFANKIYIPPKKEVSIETSGYADSPCIDAMMADKNPPRELWHKIIYTLAKSYLGQGLTAEQAIDMFDKGFFGSNTASHYSRASYIKVVRSVYKSGISGIGCKTGLSSDAMKHYCINECVFNESFDAGKALRY